MRHIGNVHAHFPQARLELPDGQRVVEVLGIAGVDGEGHHVPAILPFGIVFRGNLGRNLLGGRLHINRISIGQAVLGENGVHLGGVVARLAQHIDHLAERIAGLFGPLGNPGHHLVAVLAALELVFGDEDIISQRVGLGQQEGIVPRHFQAAHQGGVGPFDNLDDLPFGLMTTTARAQGHLHLIVVHGMGRVAFGYQDRLPPSVGQEAVPPVALALEGAGHHLPLVVQLIMPRLCHRQETVLQHFLHRVGTQHLERMRREVQPRVELLQCHAVGRPCIEITGHEFRQLFLLHALPAFFLFFLLSHVVLFLSFQSVSLQVFCFPPQSKQNNRNNGRNHPPICRRIGQKLLSLPRFQKTMSHE